jgi:Protein of unknown function (DUF3151)
MSTGQNLLGEPPATLLPEDTAARTQLDSGADPVDVVRAHPTYSLGWALLAERALAAADRPADAVAGYAYARVGYHRGLDALRRNGWRGQGPVPWEHEPNRGFLRALAALARAAEAFGETEELERCATLLRESSRTAAAELGFD